jgi:hypothetical protein
MSSQFKKKFPSLTRDNSVSIMKAECCSLIGLAWGSYWDKNTIEEKCLDKVRVQKLIVKLKKNFCHSAACLKSHQGKIPDISECNCDYRYIIESIDGLAQELGI